MTSSRKVKLQDRGTPEPKPSRKVVLDELLRSLQDLVSHELAVDVALDDAPAATEAVFESRSARPATEPSPPAAVHHPEPDTADFAVEELVAAPVAETIEIEAIPAPEPAKPAEPPRRASVAASKPEAAKPAAKPKPLELSIEPAPVRAEPVAPAVTAEPKPAKPATRSKPLELAADSGPIATAPKHEPSAPAATVEPKATKPTAKSKGLELAAEPGPAARAPERKPAAAELRETANTAPKSKPLALAVEAESTTPRPEPQTAPPAPEPAMGARSRRGKLGDTVVLTPPRDLPPPPAATAKRGGRQAVVETPVPPGGLQQQLPYLDVSPTPDGTAGDTGLHLETEIEIPHLPGADRTAREAPVAKGSARAAHEPPAQPEIEIPDLPSTGSMSASPAIPSPLDRAAAMATDGPDELPDLDFSALPAAPPAKPTALSVVDDDTGPTDIPLLEDAIDLDEHIELSSPKPSATAKPGAPRPAGSDPRRLAIQLAARLNVDLRREGKPVLGSDVIAKLARMLEESLAKGAPNMENTRPKKP